MGIEKTEFAARMKSYEQRYSTSLMPMLPILCRIDGRCFSRFTKGLKKPYDPRLMQLMIDTTKFLVEETNARCGYTQSDEITLVWVTASFESEIFFAGKLQKMVSVVGSLATAFFNKNLADRIPEKGNQMPVFDNRVWQVPTLYEAVNAFIWRQQDATRNSIQSAARAVFSHKECNNKNTSDLQEMLFQKGINWNDYPSSFKRGTFIRNKLVEIEKTFTAKEIAKLPADHAAHQNPTLKIERSKVAEEKDLPPLTKITNRDEFVFFGAEPIYSTSTT